MSRVKSPQEKKRLSLDRDRRNAFGENSKSSRKNIPRSKQLSHMRVRRAVRQLLDQVKGDVDETKFAEVEGSTRTRSIMLNRRSFKKKPDQPLREVLERKRKPSRRQAS